LVFLNHIKVRACCFTRCKLSETFSFCLINCCH